ncbi:Crp/Fnr family transcriptional regulator [Pararhodobacter zhoushanensis]|uniref:Crp/Fnr family transcriptional regulator n=1 Tax=Pararhodobacter zhoushanensis TaxID=2479545 RepID=UPI000F8DE97E|nr:Crp/Fnr family transcriptional regulator [Pararhodobacter zhoushanensis]
MGWAGTALPGLDAEDRARLDALPVQVLPDGAHLFSPGDRPQGFAMVLSGRIEVSLTGPNGREILLYAVEPGQSCIQTTLGLLGDDAYSGEAVCIGPVRVAVIPGALFHALMARSEAFRGFVFHALATRMNDMTQLLERVAFTRVEARLAGALLDLGGHEGIVEATHADLAARIGSAREVVSRRLEAMAKRGMVSTDRGRVALLDPAALRRLAVAL